MRALERAYPVLLLAPVALPLVIGAEIVYPYLVAKTLLFYALSLLSAAAFILLVAYGRPFHFARLSEPLTWTPAALLVLAYVASLVGLDFHRSFWSLFIRGDGLLMLTGVVGYFYLVVLSADRRFLSRLLFGTAIVGTLVALYGIGEWLLDGGRIGSLLGNAAFFANYLGIAFFATLAAASAARNGRTALFVGAALQIVAIFLTATRGTILALGVALVAYLAYLAVRGAGRARSRSRALLGLLAVGAVLFLVFRAELVNAPIAPLARFASIGTNDPDVVSRLFIWENMMGEIAKRPVFGVGAEHVSVLFDHFYDPTQIQEEWFDRSHNAYLDYAAQFGLLGGALYVLIIASFLVIARRLAREGEGRLGGLMALLALTYAGQNFFAFDTISSFWIVMILLAALLASRSRTEREALSLGGLRHLAVPAAAVLVILIVPTAIRPAQAAYDLAQAYKYQLTDPAQEAAYVSRGFALGTYGDVEYGYEAYDMYVRQSAALTGEKRLIGYQAAKNVLAANFRRYPYDARTALYYAHVLSLAPPEAPAEPAELSAALTSVIDKSPKRAQAWYILANLSIAQANAYPVGSVARVAGYASAKDIITKYQTLVPTLALPHFVLAQIEYASDEREAAAEEAALGRAAYRPDLETARRAASYYVTVQDLPNAEFFLTEVVSLAPADRASQYDLAKIKFLRGDTAGAAAIVADLRAKDPAIITTDPAFEAAIAPYESR